MHLSLFAYELYSDSKRDYHTVCVPITAQMTSLLMYDSTLYCVENDSMNDSLKIRDKPLIFSSLTLHLVICMARHKAHLAAT